MNLLKNFLTFIAVFSLAIACANKAPTQLEQLNVMEEGLKNKGGYESYLALEYLVFARSLFSVKDEKNSEYFATKALTLTKGGDVVPENPITWKVDQNQIEEMVLMQRRLEEAQAASYIKFYLPIQLAHLTYLYDCWISRESKSVFRAQELSQCRTRFIRLLDEVESYIDDLKKDKQPKVEIKEPEFERFEIIFDLGNYKFNDKANLEMLRILKYLESLNGDYRILVVGNADRVGSEIYNENLSLNRAEITKNYLIKNGVNKDLIDFRSFGEDLPDIVTIKGMQQQRNRSVGIYVLKGFGTFASFPLPLIENQIYAAEIRKAREERGLKN